METGRDELLLIRFQPEYCGVYAARADERELVPTVHRFSRGLNGELLAVTFSGGIYEETLSGEWRGQNPRTR
jgi:hypothetical protein